VDIDVVDIDPTAPAVARGEVDVAAPRELVWDVLTDIAAWPSWSRVKSASLSGPLAAGTVFRWKDGPATITSTLRQVEPPRLIAWTGSSFGIKAIHVHRLEGGADTTVVSSQESWDGLLVRLLRRWMATFLHKAIDSGLQQLKTEAERRAATRA
jgi:uncharacterized protein YndB with AHSA1/START domain